MTAIGTTAGSAGTGILDRERIIAAAGFNRWLVPPAALPGGFLAERFYFASYDAPLYRSEYLIATPPGMNRSA